jgi:cytochrome c oxidase subunit 2
MRRIQLLTVVLAVVGALGWSAHATDVEPVIHVTAKKFAFEPSEITLRKGVPVVLEITSLDREHGFKVPALGIRADIEAGATTRVRVVPDRVGRFEFRCDIFCGSGHEEMAGDIVVVE